ncbi:MBL fold metallo-hydrolase [Aggregicoccus sp. 17bor-14]|uniref:MBL fold metallo-hydrolase n=1 Tax=Myxococcaceae TaxID=31 RepID=UPI00129CE26D|nr:MULTISPECIES: hypothetical protein [Myxococcaceae]MBF5043319.1 hypothetical protein [Simulacricoccus sp. 17bor-14]MRI89078.1 MBL fold metallo-hydrolase [Aggregicoccus sp. 17bor-14]
MSIRRLGCALAVLGLAGCASPGRELRLTDCTKPQPYCAPPQAGTPHAELTYLGAGGSVVRFGGEAVMFAPSYTNPDLPTIALGANIVPDVPKVDACLAALPRGTLDGVRLVLVGHSHYDHLLDVEPVVRGHLRGATVLGTPTAGKLLTHARRAGVAFVDMSAHLGAPGDAYVAPGGRVRVLALASDHAPHALGLKLLSTGIGTKPNLENPTSAMWDWIEGEAYAYVVDFLGEGGRVAFRVFYQDAASSPGMARMPPGLLAEHWVDLAITSVGGYEQVSGGRYPETVLCDTRPRFVMLGHWEDFFGNGCLPEDGPQQPLRTLGREGLHDFIGRVNRSAPAGADWLLPEMRTRVFLPAAEYWEPGEPRSACRDLPAAP